MSVFWWGRETPSGFVWMEHRSRCQVAEALGPDGKQRYQVFPGGVRPVFETLLAEFGTLEEAQRYVEDLVRPGRPRPAPRRRA